MGKNKPGGKKPGGKHAKKGGPPKKIHGQGKIGKKAALALGKTIVGSSVLHARSEKQAHNRKQTQRIKQGKELQPRIQPKKKKMSKRDRGAAKEQLYPDGKRLLLVGEGDFSFTAALIRLRGHGGDLVSTCLDTQEQLDKKYPGSKVFLDQLKEQGAVVVTGVDATNLQECEAVGGSGAQVDNIIFNFPHTGCGIKDKAKNVALHQKLLVEFFTSAKELINAEGEIHVTLKRGEPYESWRLQHMARDAGLVLKTAFPFSADMFPGYAHCKTAGVQGLRGDNSIIKKIGARIYVFSHPWDRSAKTFTNPPRFRHDMDDASSAEDMQEED